MDLTTQATIISHSLISEGPIAIEGEVNDCPHYPTTSERPEELPTKDLDAKDHQSIVHDRASSSGYLGLGKVQDKTSKALKQGKDSLSWKPAARDEGLYRAHLLQPGAYGSLR